MIALLYHERMLREGVHTPSAITIYRMQYNAPGGDKSESGAAPKSKKRQKLGSGDASVAKADAVAKPDKPRRMMEYVNIPMLYQAMYQAMEQCSGMSGAGSLHAPHFMQMFACLVGLTGTDFTRSTPLVGVKVMWDMLATREVWNALAMSYNTESGGLIVTKARDTLMARIYRYKFPKHTTAPTPGAPENLPGVLSDLREKLGGKNKELVPTESRLETTVRNTNWLLMYWRCDEPVHSDTSASGWDYDGACPDPICPEYGFRYSNHADASKRVVQWGDA
jgi:hypothetical protein